MGYIHKEARCRGGSISINATLISTVYNEEETIEELLESIIEQSHQPDEAIIVDGGSDDKTYDIIQEYAEKHDFITVIQKSGCNIAEGRNIAIQKASNDYIVGTDGGCVLDERWYEEMTNQFENGAEYVIGMFKPLYKNIFEKVQGKIVCSPHTVDELEKGNRGPSSRSVGFSKQAWNDAGGYPENLYTGEDSKFNAQVMASGYEPVIAENAYVYWRMRPRWKEFFDQFYTYGKGDAQGGNLFTHPSQKLGISKNIWLKLQSEATIIAFLAVIYSIYTAPKYLAPTSIAFLGLVSSPSLYYRSTLLNILKSEGIYAYLIGLCLTQTKAWGWYIGFKKELLQHPNLFVKQITELRKHNKQLKEDGKMRILHVSSYPPWKGGIADYMAMLHTDLNEECAYNHEILALTEAGGDDVHAVLEKEDSMSFVKGFQHVRDNRPDVLHIQHELNLYGRINFLTFAFLLLLWKPFTSTSFVTTLHTYEKIPLKLTPKGILRFIGYRLVTYNLIYLLSDRIIVHNDVLAERMDRDDVTVIPHGVKTIDDAEDIRQEYGFDSDDIFLLCMGFLSDGKGFDYAIEALKDLPEDYKLLVIGSPPPNFEAAGEQNYERLQGLVKQKGLENQVELRKRFIEEDEIDNLIHSCDIMLFPYRGSSQSGMMHRAIGAGADIICSDLDVFQAVLGDAGTYFQQGDSSTLAQTIKAFEPNKGAIDGLKERMKWSSIAEKHMELYRRLKA